MGFAIVDVEIEGPRRVEQTVDLSQTRLEECREVIEDIGVGALAGGLGPVPASAEARAIAFLVGALINRYGWVLAGKASDTTTALVSMAVSTGRAGDLPDIVEQVVQLGATQRSRQVAFVRSAVALTDVLTIASLAALTKG